jgi:hypothetical protein
MNTLPFTRIEVQYRISGSTDLSAPIKLYREEENVYDKDFQGRDVLVRTRVRYVGKLRDDQAQRYMLEATASPDGALTVQGAGTLAGGTTVLIETALYASRRGVVTPFGSTVETFALGDEIVILGGEETAKRYAKEMRSVYARASDYRRIFKHLGYSVNATDPFEVKITKTQEL